MINYLEKIFGKLNEQTKADLADTFYEINIQKGQAILNFGETCKHLWFLQVGALKAYEIQDGEAHITHFFIAECFITNYISIITQQASELCFEATENSKLFKLNYSKLEACYQKNHQLEHIGRKMAEFQFVQEYQLRKQLLSFDALQRYELLEQTNAEVFNRYNLKDIASYLGMTPVSLSRLRKQRIKNKLS